jgi:single-strand DNA-binding protein
MDFNKVLLGGRIAKDIETKRVKDTCITKITIATNRKYRQGEETKKESNFIDAIAFARTAENIATYFKKGDPIFLECRIKNSNYEKDGKKIYKNDLIIEEFYFVSSPKKDD